ncbi:ABC transporter related [Methylocella silvestris BL2]|uniref:ABC transporter related n=1 Tax=Methylocella silvestris (strain DSM 15510 / CIP 108128 / LMG 27833 / NCIMB 13906 / BL2) TaxID=395965 RepID=B8ER24_METSB|nr:ABC transporter ATP-binding protein/permease [Methylocella silvestris]ACK49769.1 ABC transporter related [Methylocella silvestris BL2]
MIFLAALVAVFSLVTGVIGAMQRDATVLLLAVTGLICAYTTFKSPKISSFLQIFAAIFAAETVLFGVVFMISQVGMWPASLADYVLPESLPLTVAIFAILVYAISFIPVVQSMTRIGDRYFDASGATSVKIWPLPSFVMRERWLAIMMVVFLVVINQAQVGIQVRLSFFSRDWFNAIQNKDQAAFWSQLFTVFTPWAFIYIASAILEFVVASTLIIRWRRWLTEDYVSRWLDRHTHYRMSLAGGLADNPDQRISEDVNRFINGGQEGYGIYTFSILLISNLSSLVSFAILLWDLSANFTLPGTSIAVPGFLFWVALIYAGFGTWITHLIGRSLVQLSFARQRYEADFRFSLARLREYAEQVALLSGESAEKASLGQRFMAIITNYFQIVRVRKNLIGFTASYGQLSPIIPYIVAAPFYFAGKITLGVMTQTARAFGSVDSALTFFVTYYVSLADFKAVLDRLISFDASIEAVQPPGGILRAITSPSRTQDIGLTGVTLKLPDGRVIVKDVNLQLAAGEPTLLTGASGSGKSTLFRAISGIWPIGEGTVSAPDGARLMLLPQKPYIPNGTLIGAVTYPAAPDAYDEADVRAALAAASLPHFADQLHVDDNWGQRLSGGEQQRLAVARALLAKPDWLFLDEATASMDENLETKVYDILFKELRETTIVSIGHRSSLIERHKRHIEMRPGSDGAFTLVENSVPA